MKTIIIKLEGGLVQDIQGIPEGYKVQIHDYDVEGVWEEDNDEYQIDEDGKHYGVSEW